MTRRIQSTVLDTVRPFAGASAYFEPLAGNHGDRLILLGAQNWLAQVDLRWTDDPAQADIIVINGGGGLFVQPWCGDLGAFRRYTLGFPATPIVVLPSSFYWGDHDLPACFAGRSAPTMLFARELTSLARIETAGLPEGVSIGIECDMAFRLEGTPLIEDARHVPSEGYILVVERFDEEQATGRPPKVKRIRRFAGYLPVPLQYVVKKMLDWVRRRNSDFTRTSLGEALRLRPELAGKPVLYNDVSNPTRNTFEEFVWIVTAADAVITTRLHAGILAAMLGKPTFMKGKSGEYRKLQSVYEYSLASLPHVHLLEPSAPGAEG